MADHRLDPDPGPSRRELAARCCRWLEAVQRFDDGRARAIGDALGAGVFYPETAGADFYERNARAAEGLELVPALALAEVCLVLRANDDRYGGKHAGFPWRQLSIDEHRRRAASHRTQANYPPGRDPESRYRALAHAIARDLMALELEIRAEIDRRDEAAQGSD